MKRAIININFIFIAVFTSHAYSQDLNNAKGLKIIFIRHGEKPAKGDNLTCEGLNRSLQLPNVISSKFGIPNFIYTPSLITGQSTKRSRMFQTVTPLAIKYNISINSNYDEKDSSGIANDLKNRNGIVLVVWEHKAIIPIVRSLGITNEQLTWNDDDYNSIWIVTFLDGIAILTKDTEGITPFVNCPF
ncbi:MAG TPA: hypothetical protein VK718_06475 [Ferruginibacter sp.]|jgi:hypothetical protein|nr:hypothetical protein [Ferruginibacter sp.]